MFYYKKINYQIPNQVQNDRTILKSDLIKGAEAFFTTRDICICDKGNTPSTILPWITGCSTASTQLSPKRVSLCSFLPKSAPHPEKEDILNNKKILADYLKISEKNLISPTQTHSANIDIAIESRTEYPETDALILTKKNIGIFLNFADCTPVILYDKKLNIGAVAHAGWRGTAQKIAPKTVQKMGVEFGSKPKDIVAVIGPAIGFCCYNVGEEVYNKLAETVENFDGLSEIREGEIFVDLKNINKRQLEEVGIKEIDVCPYCTVCDNDKFFSYRNENATTSRHSAVLKLG